MSKSLSDIVSDYEGLNTRILGAADSGDWELFLSIASARAEKLDALQEALISVSSERPTQELIERVELLIETQSAIEEIIKVRLAHIGNHLKALQVTEDLDRHYIKAGSAA